jgi:hypothetical protein
MASEYTHAFQVHNMVGAPEARAEAVQVMFRSEDGVMQCYGTAATNVAPLTDAGEYAPGCSYTRVVDSASVLYLNTGTKAVPVWTDQK